MLKMRRPIRCRKARERVVIVNSRCPACEEWLEMVVEEKTKK